ncbi:hypothetical protein C2845_PM14G06730 [Panicum miliaceum]|uniref:Thioredoxin domain-containing protein n=1 Tax=Panicum miliaceum TaxID=4540 RepID=A0A3L6PPP0_PANMI|nr:hypothetical protein C2845_PM14G06730 [Panicum miliaceum]
MDEVVSQILEKQVLSAAKAVEDKIDEEIAALDRLDPDDIEALRERRIQQMRRAAERRAKWRAQGHGEYAEVPEKEFFAAAKASERLVCHFYRDNWPCKVLDKHLSVIAKQHVETRFIKVHAEKAPFLTEKLRIVVLPTLAIVKNAKVEDYVVGFDELGGKDDFSTEDLEERLAKSQVIFLDGEGDIPPCTSRTTLEEKAGRNFAIATWLQRQRILCRALPPFQLQLTQFPHVPVIELPGHRDSDQKEREIRIKRRRVKGGAPLPCADCARAVLGTIQP